MRPLLMKSSESHISPSSERMWEEMKIVLPSLARTRMRCLSSTRAFGSRPAAGSSMIEHLRVVEQRAAEAEALGHALGKLVRKAVGERDEVGELHDLLDAVLAFGAAVAEGAGVEIEVFEHGHVVVIAEMVGHPADEPADVGRVVDDIDAADLGGAHGGVVEGGEDPHGGRLAGAVGADEAADRAVRDLEGDAVDGLELAEVAVEVVDDDGGHGRGGGKKEEGLTGRNLRRADGGAGR